MVFSLSLSCQIQITNACIMHKSRHCAQRACVCVFVSHVPLIPVSNISWMWMCLSTKCFSKTWSQCVLCNYANIQRRLWTPSTTTYSVRFLIFFIRNLISLLQCSLLWIGAIGWTCYLLLTHEHIRGLLSLPSSTLDGTEKQVQWLKEI